jgi:5'-deoxynucleotidase
MSHFFAYLSRMKFIKRWGLMHNTYPESVQEHSLRVAQIAHALAVIRNRRFGGNLRPERAALLAIYHDATEVMTGDLPAPIKYSDPEIQSSYKAIEASAAERLVAMVPVELRDEFEEVLIPNIEDGEHVAVVKAADKLCAYLKCLEELGAGNREFGAAEETLRQTVEGLDQPEVEYFLETFAPSFRLTLDELGKG